MQRQRRLGEQARAARRRHVGADLEGARRNQRSQALQVRNEDAVADARPHDAGPQAPSARSPAHSRSHSIPIRSRDASSNACPQDSISDTQPSAFHSTSREHADGERRGPVSIRMRPKTRLTKTFSMPPLRFRPSPRRSPSACAERLSKMSPSSGGKTRSPTRRGDKALCKAANRAVIAIMLRYPVRHYTSCVSITNML